MKIVRVLFWKKKSYIQYILVQTAVVWADYINLVNLAVLF